jgi:hypothetical protein
MLLHATIGRANAWDAPGAPMTLEASDIKSGNAARDDGVMFET